MLKLIEDLLAIQENDRRIIQLRRELQGLPARKTLIEQRMQQTKDALTKAEEELKHGQSVLKQLELETEDLKQKITRMRSQQFEVKTNEEYKVLEREIAESNHKIRGVEDREIEQMERIETLKASVTAARKELDSQGGRIKQELIEADQQGGTLETDLKQLEARRGDLLARVSPEWLSKYERIMKHWGDYAVVAVEHGSCGGCHMKLQPQALHDARKASAVCVCTFCGRFLYSNE